MRRAAVAADVVEGAQRARRRRARPSRSRRRRREEVLAGSSRVLLAADAQPRAREPGCLLELEDRGVVEDARRQQPRRLERPADGVELGGGQDRGEAAVGAVSGMPGSSHGRISIASRVPSGVNRRSIARDGLGAAPERSAATPSAVYSSVTTSRQCGIRVREARARTSSAPSRSGPPDHRGRGTRSAGSRPTERPRARRASRGPCSSSTVTRRPRSSWSRRSGP